MFVNSSYYNKYSSLSLGFCDTLSWIDSFNLQTHEAWILALSGHLTAIFRAYAILKLNFKLLAFDQKVQE